MSTIAKYFSGVGAKRLKQVEIKPNTSNQHEFNGISGFKKIFGTDKIRFNGRFLFLSDEEEKVIEDTGILTWYDSREEHETRTEYRLYYSTNNVIAAASVNDLIIIGRVEKNELIVVIAREGSTTEKQLLWLFGLAEVENAFVVKDLSNEKQQIGFAAKYIIESLGLEIEEDSPNYLDAILKRFGDKFPKTNEFSEFARQTLKEASPIEDPDTTLLQWMEREELLFRTLERHIVEKKLHVGFNSDVDDFISFSLSVQNRRKSRAGYAFENHLATVFDFQKIRYSKKKKTERNNEPDFLFPGIKEYSDKNFAATLLTMLGVKTTAKDRWRQVLPEAERIWPKHLITLEPAISKNQTDEMRSQKVQLVLPKALLITYSKEQQHEIIDLSDFISIVKKRQVK